MKFDEQIAVQLVENFLPRMCVDLACIEAAKQALAAGYSRDQVFGTLMPLYKAKVFCRPRAPSTTQPADGAAVER